MLSSGKRAFGYASALLHGDIDNCKQDKKQMDLFQKILAVFNLWSFIWKRLKQSVLADHRGISLILLLNIFPKFISITTALSSIWWTWQMYCRCCCVIVLHASIDCSGHELKQQLQHLLSTQVKFVISSCLEPFSYVAAQESEIDVQWPFSLNVSVISVY